MSTTSQRWLFVILLLSQAGAVATAAQAQDVDGKSIIRDLNPLSQIDPSSLTGFVERPLFSKTRKITNAESIAAPVAVVKPVTLKIRLIGLLQTPQGVVALITDLDSGSKLSLKVGDSFHDWSAISIDAASLTMRKGKETAGFELFKKQPSNRSALAGSKLGETSPGPNASPLPDVGGGESSAHRQPSTPSREAQDIIDVFGAKGGTTSH